MTISERDAWQTRAACRGVGPDIFYLGPGRSPDQALAYCAACPVIDPCRDHGLHHEPDGIWGGIAGKRALKRERARLGIRLTDLDDEEEDHRPTYGPWESSTVDWEAPIRLRRWTPSAHIDDDSVLASTDDNDDIWGGRWAHPDDEESTA